MGHPHLGFSFHKAGVGVGGKSEARRGWLFLEKGWMGGRGPPRWGSESESSSIVTERQTHPLGLITGTMPGHHELKACVLLSMPSSQIWAPGLHLWSWHLPKKPCADGYLHVKTRAIVRLREQELLCSIISLSWDVGGGFWSLGKLACNLTMRIWVLCTCEPRAQVSETWLWCVLTDSLTIHDVPRPALAGLKLTGSPRWTRIPRSHFPYTHLPRHSGGRGWSLFEELQTNEFPWALGLHGFVAEAFLLGEAETPGVKLNLWQSRLWARPTSCAVLSSAISPGCSVKEGGGRGLRCHLLSFICARGSPLFCVSRTGSWEKDYPSLGGVCVVSPASGQLGGSQKH